MIDQGFLPYARQSIDEADIAAVTRVLRGEWLTTGPAVAAFEEDFARSVDARHAIACSSGGAGLHLAYAGLGIGPGDRVVVPSITFTATASMARLAGAEVVIADVDADTALLTEEGFRMAAGGLPVAAVAPVHMAGQSVDMAAISRAGRDLGAYVIEDACHALGGVDGAGGAVGACADSAAAVFSLHPAKVIAAGEGGVVATNDDALAAQIRSLRTYGVRRDHFVDKAAATAADGTPNPWYYEVGDIGSNYRLSDINAALARSQLGKLPRFVERRRELVALYDQLLSDRVSRTHGALRPMRRNTTLGVAWHLYVALIDFPAFNTDRAAVMQALKQRGVGTQVHYIPLHRQPYFRSRYGERALPGAEAWYARALSLPLYPGMTDSDAERVVAALDCALGLSR